MLPRSDFSRFQLEILLRLLPANERALALNLRSHNPVDVDLVVKAQSCVDDMLAITGDPVFRSTDDIRLASVKAMRNVLGGYVKNILVSRWFCSGADEQIRSRLIEYVETVCLAGKLRKFESSRSLQFIALASCLILRKLRRSVKGLFSRINECALTSIASLKKASTGYNKGGISGVTSRDHPAVVFLTSGYHQMINYTLRSVADGVMNKGCSAVVVFRDGFDPTKAMSDGNWKWCEGLPRLTLTRTEGSFSHFLGLLISRGRFLSVFRCVIFAFGRVLGSKSPDWQVKFLLLRKIPRFAAAFCGSLWYVTDLVSRIRPISVVTFGSESLHVKSFAYECAIRGIRLFKYHPVALFPVIQPAFSSIGNIMLATPEDERSYSQDGAACSFWRVGSPVLDLAAPYVLRNVARMRSPSGSRELKRSSDGSLRTTNNILFFTKRNFPNVGVISSIAEYCQNNGKAVNLTVKFHPSDSRQISSGLGKYNDFLAITYHGRDEIEQVDKLIFEADMVLTGSSNVIWSAFAQFKPVVYLAFKGMSSEDHVQGYSRYSTSEFFIISDLSEVQAAIEAVIEKLRKRQISTNYERHDSLLRDFFCDGEFNSTERICRVLCRARFSDSFQSY